MCHHSNDFLLFCLLDILWQASHEGNKEASQGLKAEQVKVKRLEELKQELERQCASHLQRLDIITAENNRYIPHCCTLHILCCALPTA
jgi:hypothetical protein